MGEAAVVGGPNVNDSETSPPAQPASPRELPVARATLRCTAILSVLATQMVGPGPAGASVPGASALALAVVVAIGVAFVAIVVALPSRANDSATPGAGVPAQSRGPGAGTVAAVCPHCAATNQRSEVVCRACGKPF